MYHRFRREETPRQQLARDLRLVQQTSQHERLTVQHALPTVRGPQANPVPHPPPTSVGHFHAQLGKLALEVRQIASAISGPSSERHCTVKVAATLPARD